MQNNLQNIDKIDISHCILKQPLGVLTHAAKVICSKHQNLLKLIGHLQTNQVLFHTAAYLRKPANREQNNLAYRRHHNEKCELQTACDIKHWKDAETLNGN